jgi:hypothetical protein
MTLLPVEMFLSGSVREIVYFEKQKLWNIQVIILDE